jgi:hypothetical protein
MKSKLIKFLIVAAVMASLSMTAQAVPTTAAIQVSSGASTVTIQDNAGTDLSPSAGQIMWSGSINGWNLMVTVGDTKPILGSATSPQMDLTVTANTPGAAPLTVRFTDTGFGPTAGSIISTHFNNGTASETASVLVDPLNAQFGGLPATSINLASAPYSITLVDTFTVGTISADHRIITTVPDGGTTVLLLGAALSALGLIKRRLA